MTCQCSVTVRGVMVCLGLFCGCLGPAACNLCACNNREPRASVLTRFLFSGFFLLILVISAIMLSPSLTQTLQNTKLMCVPLSERFSDAGPFIPIIFNTSFSCDRIVGFLAVYRVCAGGASFFFIFAILMICVRSTKDPRTYIQNGFWLFKWILVIGLIVAFFFIPDGQNLVFSKAIMAFGMAGSILFILLQLFVLVDFAHSWSESWISKAEKNENNWWYFLMVVFSVAFLVASIIGTILLYYFFTQHSGCTLNKIFISINLGYGAIVSVISITPCIKKAQPNSGLLQASIVTAYCTYLVWSGISSEPYGTDRVTGGLYDCQVHNISLYVFSHDRHSVAASVVGVAVLFLTVIYTCVTLSTTRQLKKLRGDTNEEDKDDNISTKETILGYLLTDAEVNTQKKWKANDEQEELTYSYFFFHFLMVLAILYVMMQFTNWSDPGYASTDYFQRTLASTWVRVVSSWVCYSIYLWTLLAPLILGKCRDFN